MSKRLRLGTSQRKGKASEKQSSRRRLSAGFEVLEKRELLAGFSIAASASATTVEVGDTVQFNVAVTGATGSSTYAWDFDDIESYKSPTATASPSHTFDAPGIHHVWVTVTDSDANQEKAYLQVHVRDTITELDAIDDLGLVDDNVTDNGPLLQNAINNDPDGCYRIIFRKANTGVYRITSTQINQTRAAAIWLDTDSKVEFIGEPGVEIVFDPGSTQVRGLFNLQNVAAAKYALFRDIKFTWAGSSSPYTEFFAQGPDSQETFGVPWKRYYFENCQFDSITGMGSSTVKVRKSNWTNWYLLAGSMGESLWKYSYVNYGYDGDGVTENAHQHAHYNREYHHVYYIGEYIDMRDSADARWAYHLKPGEATSDQQYQAVKGSLIIGSPNANGAIVVGRNEMVNVSNIDISDNRIQGFEDTSYSPICVRRADDNVRLENNHFSEVPNTSTITLGWPTSSQPLDGMILSHNTAGSNAGADAGEQFCDILRLGGAAISESGTVDDASKFVPDDPAGWYDAGGYVDPGQYEYVAPAVHSFQINNGASSTTSTAVTLSMNVTDSGSGMGSAARFPFHEGALMQFSSDGVTWSQVEAYSASYVWTLSGGEGTKTVYARFRDVDANWSDPVSTSIQYSPGEPENQAPDASDDSATTGQDTAVTSNVLANDSDADGTINPATVVVASSPSHGVA
ncbi:MAG: PKD domain-containing protein, partial [Pirellulales bacterium]|nr:PKD domain-containing protein [Pirellulales bacterium]